MSRKPVPLTRQYDKLRELNDVRKYQVQDVDCFSVITGGSGHGKEQVQLANVLSGRMLSMGRGTDGQSSAPSTPSQGSRQGSIAAALPGSSITVGRKTPRVASRSSFYTPQSHEKASYEIDDGFEL